MFGRRKKAETPFDVTGLDKVEIFMRGVEAEKQFRDQDARRWFELAAQAGHILADKKLAALAERSGQAAMLEQENAELAAAAGQGDPAADLVWGRTLCAQHRSDEGLPWIERAAAAGHRPAVRDLAWRRQQQRKPDEAERLYRQDAEHDDLDGLGPLADWLRQRRPEEAVPVYQRMNDLGDEWAPVQIAEIHRAAGRPQDAERWYRQVIDSDGALAAHASGLLGAMLVDEGRGDEAEALLRSGHGTGQFHLAWMLESRGDYAEAERIYRELAESDIKQTDAMAGLARMLERRGELDEARPWRESSEGPDGTVPPGPSQTPGSSS